MKKGIKYAIILFLVFFSFSVVRAESKTVKCYNEDYTFDDSSQAVYCGHLKNSGFLGANKGLNGDIPPLIFLSLRGYFKISKIS